MHHLRARHLSPQYHVVFGKIVETTCNDGRSNEEINRVCETLFADSRECYLGEEYDSDGVIFSFMSTLHQKKCGYPSLINDTFRYHQKETPCYFKETEATAC